MQPDKGALLGAWRMKMVCIARQRTVGLLSFSKRWRTAKGGKRVAIKPGISRDPGLLLQREDRGRAGHKGIYPCSAIPQIPPVPPKVPPGTHVRALQPGASHGRSRPGQEHQPSKAPGIPSVPRPGLLPPAPATSPRATHGCTSPPASARASPGAAQRALGTRGPSQGEPGGPPGSGSCGSRTPWLLAWPSAAAGTPGTGVGTAGPVALPGTTLPLPRTGIGNAGPVPPSRTGTSASGTVAGTLRKEAATAGTGAGTSQNLAGTRGTALALPGALLAPLGREPAQACHCRGLLTRHSPMRQVCTVSASFRSCFQPSSFAASMRAARAA
ncbi:collagen alpha-1(I) chain-like isoform X1 [Rhea pennata]|uniref:collagen alpha-1(I) chain-like isoform X1 n=1 Tax=Rhea pennata TaxID=8795 RepID=UPI002E2603BE